MTGTHTIDLRLGDWRTALADVESVDCLISDPPYSARTHNGQQHARRTTTKAARENISSAGLGYAHLTDADVYAFVAHWSARTLGWFCVFTDSELYATWRDALRAEGRYVYAPIGCVQSGMNVRLAGDGPSNWTTWLVVARPRTMKAWGTLPGAYIGTRHTPGFPLVRGIPGTKPVWLMRAVVKDYSRAGDLIVDPFAGAGTTLLAADLEGRRAIGSERDKHTYALARERLGFSTKRAAGGAR